MHSLLKSKHFEFRTTHGLARLQPLSRCIHVLIIDQSSSLSRSSVQQELRILAQPNVLIFVENACGDCDVLSYSHLPTLVNQCVPVQKFTKVDSLLTWTLLKWELQRWKGGESLLKWSSCCSVTERCRLPVSRAAAWPGPVAGLSMSQPLNPNF